MATDQEAIKAAQLNITIEKVCFREGQFVRPGEALPHTGLRRR